MAVGRLLAYRPTAYAAAFSVNLLFVLKQKLWTKFSPQFGHHSVFQNKQNAFT